MPRQARTILGGYAKHIRSRAMGRLRMFKKTAALEHLTADATSARGAADFRLCRDELNRGLTARGSKALFRGGLRGRGVGPGRRVGRCRSSVARHECEVVSHKKLRKRGKIGEVLQCSWLSNAEQLAQDAP